MKRNLFSLAFICCIAGMAFTLPVKINKQSAYSRLENIKPAEGNVLRNPEARQPILFNWTQVIPKRKVDVLYKVKIVEILKGQSRSEALKNNKPVDVLEVKNQTQATSKLGKRINGLEYVWNVEASKKSTLGDIEMLGASEQTVFSIKITASNPKSSAQ